ncbi:MAG: hypothetical protein C0405_12125, partial [Desulfovibrio sp.]|nr:hypothetical protein [Desulfovibrio sp.]
MRVVTARRISQSFFFALFLWFCIVATLGERYWQLRGWPVNWILQLDPLVALGTLLTTGTLYSGLAWALLTIGLTAILGRFFCAWVCPFGAMHHFIGWLGRLGRPLKDKLKADAYRPASAVKYYLLFFLLTAAGGDLAYRLRMWGVGKAGLVGGLLLLAALLGLALHFRERRRPEPLLHPELWRRWPFVAGSLAVVLTFAPVMGVFFLLPFFLEQIYHYTPGQAGFMLAA